MVVVGGVLLVVIFIFAGLGRLFREAFPVAFTVSSMVVRFALAADVLGLTGLFWSIGGPEVFGDAYVPGLIAIAGLGVLVALAIWRTGSARIARARLISHQRG